MAARVAVQSEVPPQRVFPLLEMRRPNLDHLPTVDTPSPFSLRTYEPGDEAEWAAIMNTGIGEGWTAESVRGFLIERPQFDPESLFFVTLDGTPVGTACAWRLDPANTSEGYLHMVCVRPEYRGRHLGASLTIRVLERFRQIGCATAMLRTDDFRLAAIRQYLTLGFQPEVTDASHPGRWERVLANLGLPRTLLAERPGQGASTVAGSRSMPRPAG